MHCKICDFQAFGIGSQLFVKPSYKREEMHLNSKSLAALLMLFIHRIQFILTTAAATVLQCFDTVGWAAGRAYGL